MTASRACLPRRGAMWRGALALALLGGGAAAAAAAQDEIREVVGQPLLALAQRHELTTALRFNSGGQRSALAARLRDPGPPVALAEDRYVFGFACMPQGCREGGAFLAYDMQEERMFLLMTGNGAVRLSVPPDPRAWPEALRPGLRDFVPALGEAMGPR
ncbi:hypothetical protein [Roseomonas rosulenta]|uniref:hypothetical protein n=1 Tax=Roseomonas rosulenta TaxID=2748667 RepID=UPI0018DF1EB8|nr:hypothetical protein [Roseomonas rosulenta]